MTPLIEAGTTNEAWDGEAFFDTDHPVDIDDASKGTYSNNLIGATYSLADDPVGAYAAARAHGMKYLGEDGRPLNVMFDTMMVPPDLERFALTVANAQLTAQAIKEAAANVGGAGVTNVYQGSVQVIVNPRLVNQSAWYLMVTRRPIRPFIWQQRQAPNLVSLFSPTDPNVFFLRKFLYGVDARGAGGYSFPFLCARMAPS
jgi:phage major head subunit gpT-like protein